MSAEPRRTRADVRAAVRQLLERSPAFRQLSRAGQSALARDLESVGTYLSAPEGLRANGLGGVVLASGVGGTFQEFIEDVDFPDFVDGLIQGVFETIVDSSIQQMKAYADLVKSVAQTVARFAQENISDDDGRDYLAERYAEYFEIDENRCLQLRENVDRREALKRLRRLVPDGGLKRLDASAITTILIEAARRRIVANRQQLLASMVVMGIRRIDAKRKKRPRK